jgi:hypothetical protein
MIKLLETQEDESIHSLIYRTHVINGFFDFSNIITAKGGWASFPTILKDTLYLYNPIDDLKFLHLLRDIGLTKITNKTFNDPVAYRVDLEKFFGIYQGTRRINRMSLPIKYCLICIENHIKIHGYGVIKVTWICNTFCPIHKTDLHIVRAINRKEAIEGLSHILRGIHPKKYDPPSYRSDDFSDFREDYHQKDCDYIAPCLANKLKEFILANWRTFPQNLLDRNYSSERYLTEHYMMGQIYNAVKDREYQDFIGFWNDFAEIKYIDTGVVNRKAITEKVHKNTKVSCHNCKHTNCFSNLAIIPARPDDRLAQRCNLNYWILQDYLENVGMYNYTKQLKIMSKMSTKQKMKALTDFNENDFYNRYKVALDNSNFAYAEPHLRWPIY